MKQVPYIAKNENGIPTLYVENAPFLIIGGELHNSSSSSLEFMEQEVWPYLRPLCMNTVVLPIAWETMEDEKGNYDFSLLEGLLTQARREGKKLVLLWFGLWKNGESFYVPAWMKEDYRQYFRACYAKGVPSDTISPFCQAAVEADQRAFCRLMEYLKEYDGEEQTVIMVQVENEIGFLGAERDFSEAAEKKYREAIPEKLEFLSPNNAKGNSWYETFGENAPEMFMAWQYACAVEQIVSEGKKRYPLPMYVNAWLKQHPDRPGVYPSGGPVVSMLSVWKAAAPSLDFYAPDIYVPDFKGTCEDYGREGNPLFIPEARRDPVTASNAFYAFGGGQALGFSPFGIEDFMRENFVLPDAGQLEELNIEMRAFNCQGTGPYIQKSYEILQGIEGEILKYRGTDRMKAFLRNNPDERGEIISMGEYDLQLDYSEGISGSGGIIFQEEKGFYIAGSNVRFRPLPKKGSGLRLTIVRMEEGSFVNGVWKRRRILNGDELHEQRLGDLAEMKYVKICLYNA